MPAKGTALPGSCWRGVVGTEGAAPSFPPQRRDGDGGRRSNSTGPPGHPRSTSGSWDTRVPSCLAPPSRGRHSPRLCSCSAQGHALRDRGDIHSLPSSPTGSWPAQRPFLLITTIQQEHRESQRSRCPPAPGGCPEPSPPSPPGSRYPTEPSQHQGPAPASGKQLHPLPPSQQPFSGRCSPGTCPLHCPHPIWTTERGQSHVPAAPTASQGSPILPRASPPKKEDGSLERKMPAQ